MDLEKSPLILYGAAQSRPYDFARTFETAEWEFGKGVRFSVRRPQWSTYDTDGLTALVVGAHDYAIRVEVEPRSFTHLGVIMHPRQRVADQQFARHPSIQHAVARYRGNLHAGRTPAGYALEHAEYMADAAARLLEALNDTFTAEQALEDREDDENLEALEAAYEQALEMQGECIRSVTTRIYEFRKRRDRAQGAATEAVQKHLKSAP